MINEPWRKTMLNLSAIGKVIFMLTIIGVMFFYYGKKILQFLKAIFTKVNRKVYIIIYVVIIMMFNVELCKMIRKNRLICKKYLKIL